MALSYVDPNGGTFIIPAAYPSVTVAPNNGGLSTTGVLVVLGEADSGPAFDEETDLAANSFAADDISSLVAKYKSGPIVDAAKAAAGAAVDPDITVPFSRVIPVKTNKGTKASSALTGEFSGASYDSLVAKASGALGNLISYTFTNEVAEVVPTTGSFSCVPPAAATDFEVRVDGGLAVAFTVAQDSSLANILSAFGGADVTATGGTLRAGAASGSVVFNQTTGDDVVLTLTTDWVGVVVGDVMHIAGDLAGTNGYNEGWYVITAVTGGVLSATKVADTSSTAGHVAGDVVQPEDVGSTAINYGTNIGIYSPVVITWDGTSQDGVGKSLEIAAISNTGDASPFRMFFQLGTTTPVTWISASDSPYALVSAFEKKQNLTAARSFDSVEESYTYGGEIGLKVGYAGYSCEIVIDSTSITLAYKLTSVSATQTLVLGFAAYPTIGDIAAYIDSVSGFSASAGNAVIGNLPSTALDCTVWGLVTDSYNAGSTYGAETCRIKIDAYRFRNAIAGAYLVGLSGTPLGGLPANVTSPVFLTGGSKGGTLATTIVDALTAMETLRCNFVVPCFSQDASLDITAGLTEASSTYTIDDINSNVKTHVHKMSGVKTKRNRQAFLSKRGTFAAVREAASNLASYRCSMVFEDVKSALSGSTVQYQPYIAAALAASTQAGGFYKSIVRKQVNITGALQAAGDWTYNRDSDLENALTSGLLPIKKDDQGAGFYWVSDQTTYGKDGNSVYNSIQMVYAADTVALSTAYRMERAFVGKSVADVSAAVALSYLEGIMADFFRLRLIASSDDAPRGYKNAKIVIEGPVMKVSVEIKLAGAIYFIPISFYVTEIRQTAAQ